MNIGLRKERDEERDNYLYLANHDPLTGLANRKLFSEALASALKRSERNNYPLALLMIDLNDFKPVNDKFGHDTGDKLLQHVAESIAGSVRSTDLAARLGGDEFAIILEGVNSDLDMKKVLEKLILAISSPLSLDGNKVRVSASIGVAQSPRHSVDMEELQRFADQAMYEAKKTLTGIKIYTPEITGF